VAQTRLGTAAFGAALFSVGLVDWTIPVIDSGTAGYGQVRIGQSQASGERGAIASVLGEILTVRLGNAVASFCALILITRAFYHEHLGTVLLVSGQVATTALDMVYVATGVQKSWILGALSMLSKVGALLAIILFVQAPDSLNVFALILMGANASFSLGTFAWAVSRFGLRWPSAPRVRALYGRLMPYMLMAALTAALDRYDYLVVEHFGSPEAVGLYGGVLRLFTSLQALIPTLAIAFGSEMLAIRDDETMARYARHAIDLTSAFVLACAVGVWFVAGDVLALIYDDGYRSVANVLALLCLSLVPYIMIVVVGWYVLITRDRIKALAAALAVGLAVSVAIAVTTASGWGLTAIAWSVVAGKTVAAVCIGAAARGVIGRRELRPALSNLATALGMGAALVAAMPLGLPWPATIVLGGGVFIALQLALRGGPRRLRAMLKPPRAAD
jgi:O-antigen/teichoic acid export membrane protein